jgi:hypothetical protein
MLCKSSVFVRGLLIMALLGGSELSAQKLGATFDVITTAPRYDTYPSFDQCIAAINRMVNQSELDRAAWIDTAPHNFAGALEPLADSVRIVGNLCARPGLIDSLPREDAIDWSIALLRIGRGRDALRITNSLLDSLSPYERIRYATDIMQRFVNRRPVDLEYIDSVYERVNRESPRDSICLIGWMRGLRSSLYDRLRHPRTGPIREEFLATVDTALNNIAACPRDAVNMVMAGAVMHRARLTNLEGLDSLSQSTDAYRRYITGVVSRSTRGAINDYTNEAIGTQFPAISGDYWFQSRARPPFTPASYEGSEKFVRIEPHQRPVAGKINLIVRFGTNCHVSNPLVSGGRGSGFGIPERCEQTAASLRRLIIAHPDVELTIWVSTRGYLGRYVVNDSEEEARLWANYVFDHYRLPGVLVVSDTEFYRLDTPDNRRIDNPLEFEMAITKETKLQLAGVTVMMVDQDGKFVTAKSIHGEGESDFMEKIAAVKRRK